MVDKQLSFACVRQQEIDHGLGTFLLEVVPIYAAAKLLNRAALINDAGRRIFLEDRQQQLSQQQGAKVVGSQRHLQAWNKRRLKRSSNPSRFEMKRTPGCSKSPLLILSTRTSQSYTAWHAAHFHQDHRPSQAISGSQSAQ